MLSRYTTCKDGTTLKEAIQGKQESDEEVEVFRWPKVTADDRLKKVHQFACMYLTCIVSCTIPGCCYFLDVLLRIIVSKLKLIMPVDDAVESILDAFPGFLCHVYVKRC